MVRRLARVANSTASLVVKFVRLKMKLQLGGTRGCSPVQRERGLVKSKLADDSLFLDGPSVDELQTIQKRKDPECSGDTQVKNQALYDYVDGLTITMNVIQPHGRKESKEQAAEMMQDVMLSSQGGQPSSAIRRRRLEPVALHPRARRML